MYYRGGFLAHPGQGPYSCWVKVTPPNSIGQLPEWPVVGCEPGRSPLVSTSLQMFHYLLCVLLKTFSPQWSHFSIGKKSTFPLPLVSCKRAQHGVTPQLAATLLGGHITISSLDTISLSFQFILLFRGAPGEISNVVLLNPTVALPDPPQPQAVSQNPPANLWLVGQKTKDVQGWLWKPYTGIGNLQEAGCQALAGKICHIRVHVSTRVDVGLK